MKKLTELSNRFFYFAYGSNILHSRLLARCPSARKVCNGRIDNWSLAFNKPLKAGGSAANIHRAAEGHSVYGVIWSIDNSDIAKLHAAEGVGSDNGYSKGKIAVYSLTNSTSYKCLVYYYDKDDRVERGITDEYRKYLVDGAYENRLPLNIIRRFESEQNSTTLKVSFVGDIMQHDKQLSSEALRNWSYQGTFDEVKRLIDSISPDVLIGNFETTVGDSTNQGYPNFSASQHILSALRHSVGFDALVTCNNHCLDMGKLEMRKTHTRILESGITPIGTFGQNVYAVVDNDLAVLIHAMTDIMNGVKSKEEQLAIPDISWYTESTDEITNLRFNGTLHNIAYVHCGEEYSPKATERQLEIRDNLFAKGFIAVIFCHSHVIGDEEFVDNKFVTYGLGNFISLQKNLDRQIGQILTLELGHSGIVRKQSNHVETVFTSGHQMIKIVK